MFERSELRSSQEDRKENGVKNLLGANLSLKDSLLQSRKRKCLQEEFDIDHEEK
jgi:hypothetical protein